jgi:hypothetical protein
MGTTRCGHKWEPIPRWGGRYQCEWCKAIGYKKICVLQAYKTGHHIIPYVCQHSECTWKEKML